MTQLPVRVLVVDDSTFMRGALVRMIERDPRFKVVGIAGNGKEGVEKAQELKPDVMTLDVEMPIMNGIEALREIMATVKTPVIMVSTLTEAGAATTMQALELEAVDFLPKALNDKEKNIFKGADGLHDKLLAAAGVANGRAEKVAEVQKEAAAVKVPVSSVSRVNAKVVVVGSSTGGPKALNVFLSGLPAGFPLPIVVAQHMPPQFTLTLAKRLNEMCAVEVVEAKHGEVLMPGKVYIAPGGSHLRVNAAGVSVDEERGESPYKPSVDVLAESVRSTFGKQVLAVMLTGMGADGAKEFSHLKTMGAHVIAQDQASCVVYGMPKAVVEMGGASEVLPLERIAARVCGLVGI
ncbi:MAG: chemotaxis response regulator protein-glutamate methylesterase [Proteobacteria bacterium]|nr:chemotaxis response regulator protein-glutamate methylesterase [Pseudomonadota bacterium]